MKIGGKECFTIDIKIIRTIAIFLWYTSQFLSSLSCYKQYKAQRSSLEKYLFHKTALGMSFLTRIISNARIILPPNVDYHFISLTKILMELRQDDVRSADFPLSPAARLEPFKYRFLKRICDKVYVCVVFVLIWNSPF